MPQSIYTKPIALPPRIKTESGFSLIELIVVVSGLAILTSIATTQLQRVFIEFENDEIQAHLNSIAAECLKVHNDNADSEKKTTPPTSIDPNLLNKNNYIENDNNTCTYFQINPKDTKSKTHFSMGFGIANGKVTKFAIKDSSNSEDIITRCELWAGKGNCLENGSDYKGFFKHMDNVRKNRAACIINLEEAIKADGNPSNGGNLKTWDASASEKCANKTLPSDANQSSYTVDCKTNGCTKAVKIKDNKVVGIGDNAAGQYDTYVKTKNSEACTTEIRNYLEGNNEQPVEVTFNNCKDEDGELVKIYICNDSESMNKESYETCKIEMQINKCTIDLERIRTEGEEGTKHTVGAKAADDGSDLNGLPPCGQSVWVQNKVIYYKDPNEDSESKPG